MHVYLVRHGETELNRRHIHQFPSTPISEKGREEAQTTAEYLRQMNPDFIVSSGYTRALETARIIGMHVGIVPEQSELFYEIIRPASLYGRSHFNLETFKYTILSVLKRNDSRWRYKDAENLTDLLIRVQSAIEYIRSLDKKYDSVVVVTHSVFLNLLLAHMCQPEPLTFWELCKVFLKVVFTKNGSVAHLQYVPKTQKQNKTCEWQRL